MKDEEMQNEGMNVKLKHFVSLKKGRNPTVFLDSGTYPYLTMDYLRGRDKDVKYVDYDENLVPVKENEILILWDGANAGEIMQSKVGFLSSTMAKISSKNENLANHFLFYLLKKFEKVLKDFAGGTTIPHLDSHVLLHSSFFIPSLKKQTAIATFLDDKTSKIDRVIAQKQQMIALLKERKQIIIQNAVTKGLNYDSYDDFDCSGASYKNHSSSSNDKKSQFRRMKDSGVEWIGEIPEEWEVVSNKTLFKETKLPGRDSLPLLSVSIHSAVSTEELGDEDNIRGLIKIEDKTNYKYVAVNDVVFNMMRAWQGAIGAVKIEGMVSPAYIVARPSDKILASFFEYQYRSDDFIQQMNRNSKGITDFRKRLYWDEFKQLKTVLPPIQEQTEIVAHIETQSAKIEKAIKLQEQQIEKLKEFKSTLIDGAVTGKIKVSKL